MKASDKDANKNSAPVLPIDYEAEGYTTSGCQDCYPWHLEIVRDPSSDELIVREWHAIGCEIFKSLEEGATDGA